MEKYKTKKSISVKKCSFLFCISPYHLISPLNIALYLLKYHYKKVAAIQSFPPDNRN